MLYILYPQLMHIKYGKVSEKRDLACIIKKHNKNALRLNVITSEGLTLSSSYFQHFILHHFSMVKYILGS